ncbi:MAG: DNA polymerase III subunit delta [Clostridia bacterium]|nr:DNA polymerase III subunit delta [Clostridia bacterium]
MSLERIKSIVKTGEADCNVFLLYGEEEFLKAHYQKKLSELFMPDAMEELNTFHFDGKAYDLKAVDEAIESLPVFADKKLLVFCDSLIFKPDGRTGATAEYREYWENRLKDIPEYVYLLFVEKEIDKRSALYKFVTKQYIAAEFAYLDENEMTNWTVGLFKNLGKTISYPDAKYLIEITDSGMLSVKREAEKLVSYVAGEVVTKKDILEMVTPSVENKVFDMIDALTAKNLELALSRLNDLFLLKEDANRILGALIYHVDKLVNTKLLLEEGADKSAIMSKLKCAPFQASKYMRDCGKYDLNELFRLLKQCAQADAYLKSNSMDNNTLLELLLVESV